MSSSICFRTMKGWLAGCGAATAVIVGFTWALVAITSGGSFSLVLLYPALLIFVVTCLLTAIPAALVIWLSEKFGMRSILFFGCAGAVTGKLDEAILIGAAFRRGPSEVTWLFVVGGFVAGMAYWRIAGRHAGRDRGMSRDSA
jgi:hypothetical protein